MSDAPFFPAPPVEVDHVGIAVGGDIKAIYHIKSMSHRIESDGAIVVEGHTECGRTVSVLKHIGEDPLYEVNVSLVGGEGSERSYSGKEGSDACRVFGSYFGGWEKCVARAEKEKDEAHS